MTKSIDNMILTTLGIKIKEMEQKLEAQQNEIEDFEIEFAAINKNMINAYNKINSLEKQRDVGIERIKKLEESLGELSEWTREDEDRIYGRIKNLEELERVHNNRIDNLESKLAQQNPVPKMSQFKATDEWYRKAAESEEGYDISAGLEPETLQLCPDCKMPPRTTNDLLKPTNISNTELVDKPKTKTLWISINKKGDSNGVHETSWGYPREWQCDNPNKNIIIKIEVPE